MSGAALRELVNHVDEEGRQRAAAGRGTADSLAVRAQHRVHALGSKVEEVGRAVHRVQDTAQLQTQRQ